MSNKFLSTKRFMSVLAFCVCTATISIGQSAPGVANYAATYKDAAHFTVIFRFQRQTFQQDATPEEAKIVGVHLQYLKDLHAAGKVVYAGFRKDAVDGIVVFETASREEAKKLVEGDPAVKARLFAWELHDYQTVLVRGVKP